MRLANEQFACTTGFEAVAAAHGVTGASRPHLLVQDAGESHGSSDALLCERLLFAQLTSPLSRVPEHAGALRAGLCLPVGSSGFVRACMRAAGIEVPPWTCYPRALVSHMLGHPRKVAASAALRWNKPVFVKPVCGSPFHAFVLRENDQLSSWEAAQRERLRDLPGTDPVWISRVLPIAAQWRYYVLNGEVIGFATPIPVAHTRTPGIEEVASIVAASPAEGAFALDIAVLKDGTTTLLCVRDAWAVEWYSFGPEAPEPLAYLHFLWTRWSGLLLEPRQIAANSSLL